MNYVIFAVKIWQKKPQPVTQGISGIFPPLVGSYTDCTFQCLPLPPCVLLVCRSLDVHVKFTCPPGGEVRSYHVGTH